MKKEILNNLHMQKLQPEHLEQFDNLLRYAFQVTDEERKELLASGNQAIFDNRVGWAKTYLKKAGLLDSPKRATFVITDLGRQTLSKNPDRIDAKYLRQFPAFLEFQNASRNENETEEEIAKSISLIWIFETYSLNKSSRATDAPPA